MFDYMDEIVEAIKGFAETAKDAVAATLVITIKILLLLTVWVLPYEIFRDLQKDDKGEGKVERNKEET